MRPITARRRAGRGSSRGPRTLRWRTSPPRPFRSDRQKLEGELIFRYPFKSASIKGYVKKLKASYAAPSELTFTMRDEEHIFTLEEVLAMKDEEWFSRGVALSSPCNVSIVDNSLEKLEQLRQTGTKHQLIAVACSINHARQIRSLYQERGYEAAIVHSSPDKEEDEKTNEEVMRDLYNGVLDCIVQVQMLARGGLRPPEAERCSDLPSLPLARALHPVRPAASFALWSKTTHAP